MEHAEIRQQGSTSGAVWTGRALSGIAILFLAFDSAGKLARAQPVMEATVKLGYPESVVFGLGAVLLGCVLVYAVPRTSVFGAVLLTGYLGGAIATHVRLGDPLLTHTLFPIYVAVLIWGGVLLRNSRAREALSFRARG